MGLDLQKQRLSQLISAHLVERGISARNLAATLGVSPSSVTNYVAGLSYPTADTREKIARAVGMTPPELESYLNDVNLKPLLGADQIKQDVRLLPLDQFLEVAEVVMQRLVDEAAGRGLPEQK